MKIKNYQLKHIIYGIKTGGNIIMTKTKKQYILLILLGTITLVCLAVAAFQLGKTSVMQQQQDICGFPIE